MVGSSRVAGTEDLPNYSRFEASLFFGDERT
jgi:hypothetical protein